MKPRILSSLLCGVLASVTLGLAVAGIGKADDPPPPDPAPITYKGKTAEGWHYVAARHLQRIRYLSRTVPPWGSSWLERAFLCIHSFEGRWTDPNAPYYGGVQMDLGFARSYGGWALRAFGTPDRWPVVVQLSVAIQAYESGRGFYPWPNTARYCGLI